MPTIPFTISKEQTKYYATTAERKFYIGSETMYKGNHGLFNYRLQDGPVYRPEDYAAKQHHWAWFIYPTAMCESKGSFHCLNTYDRAAFTFTFMQFAAHVPNGDFIIFMRKLLQLPEAKSYFPFLEIKNGRIWYVRNNQESQLEKDGTDGTAALMKYLNSDGKNIDDQELITAARFVHWAQNSEAHRELQVETAIRLFKTKLKEYSIRFNLDGWPDYICHTICDIFHQGRARYALVQDILSSSQNRETIYNQLVNIGAGIYDERVKTLKSVHKQLRTAGIFTKTYDQDSGTFK